MLELPAALVEDLLETSTMIGTNLLNSMNTIQNSKQDIRTWLDDHQKLRKDSELDANSPTTCGIDGSYAVERMLSSSIVACAAVAIEGFVPPSETGHWSIKHDSLMKIENHEPGLETILRGLMKFMEINLAAKAPHDVILLDGSITSQFIHVNQAAALAEPNDDGEYSTKQIGKILLSEYETFLENFTTVLESKQDEKIWASLPKFTTRDELGKEYNESQGWPEKQDDRSMLTAVLRQGEFTTPKKITGPKDDWHLHTPKNTDNLNTLIAKNEDLMTDTMNVLYYKPYDYAPALRIEVAENVANNDSRLAVLLKSISNQFASYSIMEPYPLYMADRLVKNLSSSIPAIRQFALQKIAKDTTTDLGSILYSLRSYRTESGR